jgi:hypothetical protein
MSARLHGEGVRRRGADRQWNYGKIKSKQKCLTRALQEDDLVHLIEQSRLGN